MLLQGLHRARAGAANEEPALVECIFGDAGCEGTDFGKDASIHIPAHVHSIIDRNAMNQVGFNFKWSSVFLSGTLEIDVNSLESGDHLIIEADHIILNTPAKNQNQLSRKRRDIRYYDNGGLIIGTADNPVPCGVKVTLKIAGDVNARSFGALPDSIPIGAKALGGLGSIKLHGCSPDTVWTSLKSSVNAGDKTITVTGDITGWKSGDEIIVTTTDFIKEHTEEATIQQISGRTITLKNKLQYGHLGDDDTKETLLGRHYSQAAEVGLLTRNIVLDGTEGSVEDDFGARVVLTRTETVEGHHTYIRSGVGQFDGVEFKGFGQKGADRYDDYRCQILFYDFPSTEGRESYVRNCAFNQGYHTAIAARQKSDGIAIENNVVYRTVNSGIVTDSENVRIENNLVSNVEHILLYKDYFGQETKMPTSMTKSTPTESKPTATMSPSMETTFLVSMETASMAMVSPVLRMKFATGNQLRSKMLGLAMLVTPVGGDICFIDEATDVLASPTSISTRLITLGSWSTRTSRQL